MEWLDAAEEDFNADKRRNPSTLLSFVLCVHHELSAGRHVLLDRRLSIIRLCTSPVCAATAHAHAVEAAPVSADHKHVVTSS